MQKRKDKAKKKTQKEYNQKAWLVIYRNVILICKKEYFVLRIFYTNNLKIYIKDKTSRLIKKFKRMNL